MLYSLKKVMLEIRYLNHEHLLRTSGSLNRHTPTRHLLPHNLPTPFIEASNLTRLRRPLISHIYHDRLRFRESL